MKTVNYYLFLLFGLLRLLTCISDWRSRPTFFTVSIINEEYFQDEAFWFELGLAILFLSVPKKYLADVGEWDRTSLLQIFFIVPEERSLL